MLKGKRGVYILIVVNVLVWSFFVYRFFSVYNGTEDIEVRTGDISAKTAMLGDSGVYKLKLDYPDPFLKNEKLYKRNSTNEIPIVQKNREPKTSSVKTPTVPIQTPVIKYLGVVKNSSSGVATAIVWVNGQSRLAKVDEVIDGVQIKSFDNNQLLAVWGKEKFVITK